MDRILVRMPELEYFLPAASAIQNYVSQIYDQIVRGAKHPDCQVVIEIADESLLFFSPMFARTELIVWEEEVVHRNDWECVLDLRDINRVLRVATTTQKHITEGWGIMFGAAPLKLPNLGYLGVGLAEPEIDVLLDVPEGTDKLEGWIAKNYPDLKVEWKNLSGRRPSAMFDVLARTRMYVGQRSAATYMAAMLGKGLVELYTRDFPSWFLCKPKSEGYSLVYADSFSAELVWLHMEEICQNISNTKSPAEILTAQ